MKFGIFDLTKPEQRAIVVIVALLLAATIAKHYRDQQAVPAAGSTSAESNIEASSISEEDEDATDEAQSPSAPN